MWWPAPPWSTPCIRSTTAGPSRTPLDWWNATCQTIKALSKRAASPTKRLRAVGISGQMHGLVMLDKEGNLLRRSIIWCDQRTAAECEEITQRVGQQRLIEITANPALTGFTASKILWVRNHQPELYAKCAHILLPKDYVRYMLTGEFATEVSDASGMQLLDVPGRCWSRKSWRSWTSTPPSWPRCTSPPKSPAKSPPAPQSSPA